MFRMILGFAGCKYRIVGNLMSRLIYIMSTLSGCLSTYIYWSGPLLLAFRKNPTSGQVMYDTKIVITTAENET